MIWTECILRPAGNDLNPSFHSSVLILPEFWDMVRVSRISNHIPLSPSMAMSLRRSIVQSQPSWCGGTNHDLWSI